MLANLIAIVMNYLPQDEEGQGMAEYGLILALVAVLLIGAFTGLKDGIDGTLQSVVDAF